MEDSYKEADTTEYANEMSRLEAMKRTSQPLEDTNIFMHPVGVAC